MDASQQHEDGGFAHTLKAFVWKRREGVLLPLRLIGIDCAMSSGMEEAELSFMVGCLTYNLSLLS